jgi:hypothetical protein
MAEPITRLFDRHDDALAAVTELEEAGVPRDDISLIASNGDNRHGDHVHDRHIDDNDNEAGEGAAKGATTGSLLGGGAGLLAGLGMLAIPGLGPVVAAGWLASTAVGAIAGALAGGATGGLLGALKDAGHSDEHAHVYAEGVRRGGALVSVRASTDTDAITAERVLNGRGGVEAARRGSDYREAGWQSFDPEAAPLSADELAIERKRYAEDRSFATNDGASGNVELDGGDIVPPIRPGDPNYRAV